MNPTTQSPIRGIHEARVAIRRSERDPDFRKACIRDYVKAHPNEVIKLQDLARAAYGHENNTGYVGTMVKRLLKEGRLTRTRVLDGSRGRHYSYKWHEPRFIDESKPKNGPVTTRQLTDDEREALLSTSNTSFKLSDIVDTAKEFAWLHDTDSLRAFIKHLTTQENK